VFLVSVILWPAGSASANDWDLEIGDVLLRELNVAGFEAFGHVAIYERWVGGDPSNSANHVVLEGDGSTGVRRHLLSAFFGDSPYLASRTEGVVAEKRIAIVSFAGSKIGKPYTLGGPGSPEFRGYEPDDEAYRCDGLVERAYEEALVNGITGIVPNATDNQVLTNWLATYPTNQASLMSPATATAPAVTITQVASPGDPDPNDEIVQGEVTITAHADDGPNGSGITLVQFWNGAPPAGWSATPNLGDDSHNEDVEGDYTVTWDTTSVPDGEYDLYARAYDKAGSDGTSAAFSVVVANSGSPVPSVSLGGLALLGGLVLAVAVAGLAVQRRGRTRG
jgi:hypothetical protein